MKNTFELYLVNDIEARTTCLQRIKDEFGVEAVPLYANPTTEFDQFYKLVLPGTKNKYDQADEISKIDGVWEVDPIIKIMGIFNQSDYNPYSSNEDYPENDLRWNHTVTKFDLAIQKSKQDGHLNESKVTGIKIAQLDTGITYHPELSLITDYGYNFVEHNNLPLDTLTEGIGKNAGHGTRTASVIIGSTTGEKRDRNDGLFPNVNLSPYRIAKSVVHLICSNMDDAIIRAVDDGCQIITLSMGGLPKTRLRKAVEYAYKRGVIMCFAAGNNVGMVVWPAQYEGAIAVAGTNINNHPWEGSCRGPKVHISAPGENVLVANTNKNKADERLYGYTFGSGTSFAVPHVAAAAALWLNHFKEDMKSFSGPQKIEAFRAALANSAYTPSNWDTDNYGHGVLDTFKLLQQNPRLFWESQEQTLFKSEGVVDHSFINNTQTPSIREKEMLDLLLNNNVRSEKGLEKHIQSYGSETAKLNFELLKTTSKQELNQLNAKFNDESIVDANTEMTAIIPMSSFREKQEAYAKAVLNMKLF